MRRSEVELAEIHVFPALSSFSLDSQSVDYVASVLAPTQKEERLTLPAAYISPEAAHCRILSQDREHFPQIAQPAKFTELVA